MEADGIKYAPLELALQFSREHDLASHSEVVPLGFHNWYDSNAEKIPWPGFFSPYLHVKRFVNKILEKVRRKLRKNN